MTAAVAAPATSVMRGGSARLAPPARAANAPPGARALRAPPAWHVPRSQSAGDNPEGHPSAPRERPPRADRTILDAGTGPVGRCRHHSGRPDNRLSAAAGPCPGPRPAPIGEINVVLRPRCPGSGRRASSGRPEGCLRRLTCPEGRSGNVSSAFDGTSPACGAPKSTIGAQTGRYRQRLAGLPPASPGRRPRKGRTAEPPSRPSSRCPHRSAR
jgi:hypothetical protein